MIKNCLVSIFSLILLLGLSLSSAEAASNNTWLIKSKATGSEQVFAVWMDGRLSSGTPVSEDGIISSVTFSGSQYLSAKEWVTNEQTGAVRTYWSNKPIVYGMESEGGTYRIVLSAKNYVGSTGWSLPKGYKNFNVVVKVANKKVGTILLEASDTEVKTGYLVLNDIESGVHQVKLIWNNDSYKPAKKWDANIEIQSVAFEKIE
ncbi:MAG: hypothetical protein KJ593_04075 [Candidatus Omnitrophica bacterium]|nr:hypothetical protein [Candidatus Omnitrophota bacterium]